MCSSDRRHELRIEGLEVVEIKSDVRHVAFRHGDVGGTVIQDVRCYEDKSDNAETENNRHYNKYGQDILDNESGYAEEFEKRVHD